MLKHTISNGRAALALAVLVTPTFLASCAGHPGAPMTPGLTPFARRAPAAAGNVRAAQAGTDMATRASSVAPQAAVALTAPIGLAMNRHDDLYVANHSSPTGEILVYHDGKPQPKMTIRAGINNPASMTFDAHGYLYVTNFQDQRVTVYTPAGKLVKSRTLHTDPNFNPSGVQVDAKGRIWVANRTDADIGIGEIQIFNRSGHVVGTLTRGLVYPLGIVFSRGSGEAWIANSESPNDNMAVYSQSLRFVKNVATPGFVPTYLAYAKNGNLYVTNGLGASLDVFNPRGGVVKTISDGMNLPYGIAFDSHGNFYVANVGNSTITEYNPSGKLIRTIH